MTISDVAPTVREPDFAVFAKSAVDRESGDYRLPADAVLFVAEGVSPSSVERDFVAKRRDYARAGIPAYLVVDLRAAR